MASTNPGAVQTASNLGLNSQQVLAESGVNPAVLAKLENHYPAAELFKLADVIREITGDRDLGIHYCASTHPCSFGTLGMAAYAAHTLRDAWETLYRFSHLAMNSGSAKFLEEGSTVSIRWYPYSRTIISDRFFVDAIVSGWVHRSSQFTGRRIRPLSVSLTYPRIKMSDVFVDTYTSEVKFDQLYNSMTFRKDDMDSPLLYANQDLRTVLLAHAKRELQRLRPYQSLSERVELDLKKHIQNDSPVIDAVATRLCLSARSLQRKLGQENTTFNEILTSVRHELALEYLQDLSLSTLDIALILGYNQAASFSTAFKDWTGSSPSAYRRHILVD